MSTANEEHLVATARAAAREAASLLMEGYRTRPVASEKGRADLVTEYDVRSETLIRARLARDTPDAAVVGEEQGGAPGGITWYIDPLDGTMNYVHGHPCFSVSIGAIDEQGPVAGVVFAPFLGIEWWGSRSTGAFRNGEPVRVSATDELKNALLSTGFPADRSRAPDNNLATFCEVIQHVHGIRRCGSAAIDCCFVADGTYDAYWERSLKIWDLAAGCAIALAAGARLTSLTGGPADLRVGHMVLSNGRVHDAVVALVGR